MPTKTPRERFEEKFDHIGDEYIYSKRTDGDFDCLELKDVWSFIETLLEEARQEMKEKCAKKAFDFADNLEKKTGVDASYARAVGNLILSL